MAMTRSEAGKLGYKKTRVEIIKHRLEMRKSAELKYAGKKCKFCDRDLPYEKRYNNFCDHACAAKKTNSVRFPERLCTVCGKHLWREQRISCSYKCHQIKRYQEYITRWLSGKECGGSWGSVSHYVRRWLFEQRGEECERCGWQEKNPITKRTPIQVNHRDGNPENHRPENLQLLCPNCHSLTPNFGNLNYGNGRKKRYEKKAGVA